MKKKDIVKKVNPNTKTALAKKLGVSRSSLYYKSKREPLDLEIKAQIEAVLVENPRYGHKRVSLALKINRKRIRRIMKKYGLKPLMKKSRFFKKADLKRPDNGIRNIIEVFCPIVANIVWVCDFTYIKYQNKFIYLAVVMDMYTREILGFNVSRYHNKSLVVDAFLDAVQKTGKTPQYIHSDHGSEYESYLYMELVKRFNIQLSMSRKGSPWENGFVESFFGKFKEDLGNIAELEELVLVIEKIYYSLWVYNNRRIHTSLKMAPVQFRRARELLS